MSTIQTIAKNTSWLVIADFATKLLSFVLFVSMARYLGDIGFGKYSFAITFVGLFSILTDLGMGGLLIREIARDRTSIDKYFSNVSFIKIILSIIVYGCIIIAINLMNYPSDTKFIVYILGLYSLLDSFTLNLFCPIYRAFEKMEYEALVVIIKSLITALLGLTVIYLDMGIFALISVFLISGVFGFISGFFIFIRNFAKPKLEMDFTFWKTSMKLALPFAMNAIFVPIYFDIDKIMLSLMKGDAEVGWYSGVTMMVYSLLIIPSAFNGSIFPIMSRLYITDMNLLKVLYEKSFKYLLILALPIAVGTTILADKIVLLVLGEKFVNSIIVLQILSWVLVFMFLNNLLMGTLGSTNRLMKGSIITGIFVLLNIILNLILIPEFGHVGAAITTMITEGAEFFILNYYVSKYLSKIPIITVVKSVTSCFIMGYFLLYVDKLNVLIEIPLAATVYLFSLLMIGGLNKEDYQFIKNVR